MANSWATRWLDSRVRLATATICTSSCFAKPGICKALVLPPAPIRPTWIFFSDMKLLTFSVDGAYQSTAGLVRVRHIFSYGSDGAAARHFTACTNLEPLSAPLLAAAPLLTVSWHSVGSQHSLGLIELNAGS